MSAGLVWENGCDTPVRVVARDPMRKDEIISLRLHTPSSPFDPIVALDLLLALLRDALALLETGEAESLSERIEAYRRVTGSATEPDQVAAALEQCIKECSDVLSRLERHRVDREREIASLVDLVREALAIVTTDSKSFGGTITRSMSRFEALVDVDDPRRLKLLLVKEVRALKQAAVEHQAAWEKTCTEFSQKVEMLQERVHASEAQAALDPLTGVGNRRAFENSCRDWLVSRHAQFVIALVDVDHFKSINDTHGHPAGDRALCGVAQALKQSFREEHDVVTRIGGDEFAVLLAGLNLRQAESRLKMVSETLSGVDFETPVALKLTLSSGIVECAAGDTVESLLERADAALYEAKRMGRNRVVAKMKPTLRDLMKH